jgi:hypothetical protein
MDILSWLTTLNSSGAEQFRAIAFADGNSHILQSISKFRVYSGGYFLFRLIKINVNYDVMFCWAV